MARSVLVSTRCEARLKNGKQCKREGQLTRTENGRLTCFCLVHRRILRGSARVSEDLFENPLRGTSQN